MKIIIPLLVTLLLIVQVTHADSLESSLVNINTDIAIKEAKSLVSKKYPQYTKSDLRLVEIAARYRPSESKKLYVEVSFINMDTIGNVKEDKSTWVQPSTGKEMPGLIYEHIVVKLQTRGESGGSVNIINMKYPGTKSDLMNSMRNL